MSKLWLLLLLVAAFQTVHSYPAQETDYLEDLAGDSQDEERIDWGKIKDKIGQKVTEIVGKVMWKTTKVAWKVIKPGLKLSAKAGKMLIQKFAVAATSLECDKATCKTCVKLTKLGMSACTTTTISSEKSTVYFTVVGELNSLTVFNEKIKLGDMPRCVPAGFIGKVCLKAIEAKTKHDSKETQLNYCLGFLAERYSFGIKFCATYENQHFSVKIEPELFAGGLDEDGDIIIVNSQNESQGAIFGVEEYE
ncbi:hypothetical protein O3M35_002833 [Rhynocoris fuscipes]|uniref:Uncharacterized protein n=1 Tax=Rhynocoris fuscipes TaxID=488301 RepID=A0AAW1CQU7_9HEMI